MKENPDILKPAEANVTGAGISYKGKIYSCQTALKEQWFLKARVQPWKIAIFMDVWSDEYILLPIKDGTLSLAYKVNPNDQNPGNHLEYYQLINHLKQKRLQYRRKGN
ncbi:hypothetical protein FE782_22095 [Paenibacillus antri]|uniref:Uncharacterized protein n=1 Tax=Paenibacillus antri TaxID=2582848 RepID=A0A5R9G2H9_9BACL|nr:hypothetical protein [Paenibacillus antri]TLS50031.1 hypothetical protein FE782_22095 [Paenibacillus antri]